MDSFSTFLKKLLLVSRENRNFAARIETVDPKNARSLLASLPTDFTFH
jgi:hypothetical protein